MARHRMCSSFIFANSAVPDELPHNVAFHLGLHCLPKYRYPERKGLSTPLSRHDTHFVDSVIDIKVRETNFGHI